MKLNYVIAAWGGTWRRSDDERAQQDRTFFLRTHLAILASIKHDLAKITIVVPVSEEEPQIFTEFLETLPYEIIRRPNIGFSYGSFAAAWRKHRQDFDGFIFMEDDYVFIEDNFDAKLIAILKDKQADFVCGAALPFAGQKIHPAIALGLCKTSAMNRWAEVRQLPDENAGENYQAAEAEQVRWGFDFYDLNLVITDWLDSYGSPFWTAANTICWYGERSAPPMVMPLQAYGHTATRTDLIKSWQDTFTFNINMLQNT